MIFHSSILARDISISKLLFSSIDTTICSVNGKRYRYGFNGMEKDNETYGEGNAYDFGARIYDSRLGRWLSMDPMSDDFVDESPYIFCYDNPIYFVDEGGEFGIPGMIKAGLFEYAGQVASNIITSIGKKTTLKQIFFNDIDFNDVGASAIQGIFDPRAGSKRWVKIGAKLVNMSLEYYKASTDVYGDGKKQSAYNGTKDWSETNATFGVAMGANWAGNKITNKVSSSKISKSAEVYTYSSLAKSYAKKANTALILKRPKSNIETKVIFAAVNQAQAVKATDKIINSVKAVANPINNTVQNTTTKLMYPTNTSSPSAPSSPISSVIQFKPIPAGDGYYYLNPSRTEIYNSADRTISSKVDNKWKVTKTHANINVNQSQLIKR
jgi:RHS repeat-associated protein